MATAAYRTEDIIMGSGVLVARHVPNQQRPRKLSQTATAP